MLKVAHSFALSLLFVSVGAAYAAGPATSIAFHNNTDHAVKVRQTLDISKPTECLSNLHSSCVTAQPDSFVLAPHSSETVQLITTVPDDKNHEIGMGFEITTDDTQENPSTVILPIGVNPKWAFVEPSVSHSAYGYGNSEIQSSHSEGQFPSYTVSVTQKYGVHNGGLAQAAIVISPLDIM